MNSGYAVGDLVALTGYAADADIPVTVLQDCPAGIGQTVVVQFNADDDARNILAGEIRWLDAYRLVRRDEYCKRVVMRTPKVILRQATGEARREQLFAQRARDEG